MQDQIAIGSTNAHAAQRALLEHIDERLMSADLVVWESPKNVRVAVIFVLRGGKPNILKKLLSLGGLSRTDEAIVQGALAYVEGREAEAKRFLADIDIDSLPTTLAGQIALVQSALIVRDDPAKSLQLLDYVRLHLPGTLLEEAALRREIFVVSQIGDVKKFEALSRQYLRRFRHSAYAGNFRQRFASALTHLEFTKDPQHFSRLVTILNELEAEGQQELYLMVARYAIDQGQTQIAIRASDKAFALSSSDEIGAERAKLYKAAAVIVTAEGFEGGLASLKKINKGILPSGDANLLDSALQLASHIRRTPDESKANQSMVESGPSPSEAMKVQTPLPTITRAQEVLERVDQLFRRETR
jgi:chemotaxis protein MotC